MKRILIMATVIMAALQLPAASVDLATAMAKAKHCLMASQMRGGMNQLPAALNPTLALAEKGVYNPDQVVYYIFNTERNFIVVAGDDRAEEILAMGDRPLNIDCMPENMRLWLNNYSKQIDYLLSNPDIQVEKPFRANTIPGATTVEPLLTALWDQHAPYYDLCMFGDYQCLTGCPATSASMVFNYWKYPVEPTPVVPGYSFTLKYSVWESMTVDVPALPSVTFDWDNMLDEYSGNYTAEQGNAVATLMRYIGQAEHMVYGPSTTGGSGVATDSVANIADAFVFFGYDNNTVRTVKKTSSLYGGQTLFSDEEWATMIVDELIERRPIVFTAESGRGGHAFNVDGYDATTNMYHINFGWSGNGNGYFALNAFNDGSALYNEYQQMIIGIQPKYDGPAVLTSTNKIIVESFTGESTSQTFTVTGRDLTNDVTLTVEDEHGVFSTDVSSVSPGEMQQDGKEVTVTFSPQAVGEYAATVTLTSPGARQAVIRLIAKATLRKEEPVALEPTDIESTSFRAAWTDETPVANVDSYTLEVNQVGAEEAEVVATADFSALNYTGMQADEFEDFDSYCSPNGWTGSTVFPDKGGVRLGYSSAQPVGSLTTPPLDFSHSGGKITITFNAKGYGGGTGNASLVIKTGSHSFSQSLKSTSKTYSVVLDCDLFDNETVSFTSDNKRVFLTDVTITTTDVTSPTLKTPVEQGDSMSRTITGITDKYYVISGLTPGASYQFRVKAIYIDGTESEWAISTMVELPWSGSQRGDVDNDGNVNISDVTALIDILLSGGTASASADVDQDGNVNISDVTSLIDYLLSGTW